MKMGNLLSRKAWFWFGIAFCLLAALTQPALAVPFQPGNLFVAYGGSSIGVFNMNGTLVQTLSISPSSFTTGTTISGAGGVALDEKFNLYVSVMDISTTNSNSGIVKFDSEGNKVATFDRALFSTAELDYRGLAVRSGVIYVATDSGIRRIYTSNGYSAGTVIGSSAFRAVAFDSAGNLFGLKSNSVIKFSGKDFKTETTVVTGLVNPFTIAFDNNDNLYITETGGTNANKVLKFTRNPDGSYSSTPIIISRPSIPGLAGQLFGITFDPGSNTFYVINTDTTKDQIFKFTPGDTTMTAIPNTSGIGGVRWLAVYPTPEPTTAILLTAGLLLLKRRFRRK